MLLDDPAIIVALLSVFGSVAATILALRGKKAEIKVSDDANLRDDQREFLVVVQAALDTARKDAQAERLDRGRLEVEIANLRTEMIQLRETLNATRKELSETQRELREERAARRAGEDAGKMRQQRSEIRLDNLNGDLGEVEKDTQDDIP